MKLAPEELEAPRLLRFIVRGLPVAQGSKTRTTYGMREDNAAALGPWRDAVATVAARERLAMGLETWERRTPVRLELAFYLPRPKYVPKEALGYPTARPDVDKLTRAVMDALSAAMVYADDSQVVQLRVDKEYARDYIGCEVIGRQLRV